MSQPLVCFFFLSLSLFFSGCYLPLGFVFSTPMWNTSAAAAGSSSLLYFFFLICHSSLGRERQHATPYVFHFLSSLPASCQCSVGWWVWGGVMSTRVTPSSHFHPPGVGGGSGCPCSRSGRMCDSVGDTESPPVMDENLYQSSQLSTSSLPAPGR